MATTTPHTVRRLTAVTGVVLGALLVSAPIASAEPTKPIKESTIKSECKAAGGQYSTSIDSKGRRQSTCFYTDIDGAGYMDIYKNGTYLGTY